MAAVSCAPDHRAGPRAEPPGGAVQRRRFIVRGIVQGVGFRPFVHRLAARCALAGFVRNDAGGVTIEIEGEAEALAAFAQALGAEAPAQSRIDAIEAAALAPVGEAGFAILESRAGKVATAIGPDLATCPDCLAELFDPHDRRARYAFINCTHCGPRYTITRALPYDRAQTSMARFALCPDCAREYRTVADRRFHAEPNACPVCGPRLDLRAANGAPITGVDVIAETVSRLRAGGIVALKGLGGFHLACDARNADAVAELRARKQREEKPFAVMTANAASLAALADCSPAERALLESAERPIVLLRKRAGCDAALADIAPGVAWLGAMLPSTPLQWLLFHEAAGRPAGSAWCAAPQDLLLVLTSANPHGEPLVRDNGEALARLAGIADSFVLHDRDIVVRCDDSVVRVPHASGAHTGPSAHAGAVQFIRRARGYTPRAIPLAHATPPVLAFGGWFKNAVCITRGSEAFVSQHIGDLDNAASCAFLDETVAHLQAVLDVQPAAIAHDLHPDFHSSRRAAEFADALGLPRIGVQHHHAHVAAVLAEHRIEAPMLGLALDGVGLGSDGGAWGGELLRVNGAHCERLGHLRELPLPGGDRAAREPWRMAAAALHALGRGGEIATRYAQRPAAATVVQMLEQGFNAPPSSSLGRWFDAAAGLLGVRATMSFEGQAAMELEGLAAQADEALLARLRMPAARYVRHDGTLDLLPLIAQLADEPDRVRGAARFHAGLVDALAAWVTQASARTAIDRVAAAGGCLLNAWVATRLRERLAQRGIELIEARALPPNDGGLALGQAWVAQRVLFAKEA